MSSEMPAAESNDQPSPLEKIGKVLESVSESKRLAQVKETFEAISRVAEMSDEFDKAIAILEKEANSGDATRVKKAEYYAEDLKSKIMLIIDPYIRTDTFTEYVPMEGMRSLRVVLKNIFDHYKKD